MAVESSSAQHNQIFLGLQGTCKAEISNGEFIGSNYTPCRLMTHEGKILRLSTKFKQ